MFERFRRRWSAPEPVFDDAWEDLLDREFEHWHTLTPDELERMRMLVASVLQRHPVGGRPTGSPSPRRSGC